MSRRRYVRALVASAAVAAALVLAGCDPDGISPTGRSQAPLSEKMLGEIEQKNMDKGSPILARIFKEEAEMEVWKQDRNGQFALLKTYPICRWSGELGPKVKEGDRQAPEGFYNITPGQMNPNSNYYLAFNTGYPNTFDRAWNRTGSELMVHGDCSSRGCYAMTDEQMVEIYALARESFFGGQKSFQLQAFPFRMTSLNMAKHRNNPNYAFWKMLRVGYDHFEATHQQPKVDVCEKRYVFDAAPTENASRISFNARGKCPAYRTNPEIAQLVLEKQRESEFKTAEYIASGVATMPLEKGVDGGMNPVFATKLASHDVSDNDGRIRQVAGNTQAPGALPRTPNLPVEASADPRIQAQPRQQTAMANVPVPRAAPLPKEGHAPAEQPSNIAGLFGNLFGGGKSQAEPAPAAEPETAEADAERPAPRNAPAESTRAQIARPAPVVKPKPSEQVRVATAPEALAPRPRQAAAPETPKPRQAIAQKREEPATQQGMPPWPEASRSPWPPAGNAPQPQQAQPQAQPQPRVAAAPAQPRREDAPKPKAVAVNQPPAEPKHVKPPVEPKPRVAEKEKKAAPPPQREMRTAYSAPTPSNGGLLSGAQPVVPTGSFR